MPSIEAKIEAMWENPQSRRERWLGFFGKFVYEVGGATLAFGTALTLVYLLMWGLARADLVTNPLSLAVVMPLYALVANSVFCSIIGR